MGNEWPATKTKETPVLLITNYWLLVTKFI